MVYILHFGTLSLNILDALKIVANSLGDRNNVDLFESDLDVEFLGGILADVTLHTLAEVYLNYTTLLFQVSEHKLHLWSICNMHYCYYGNAVVVTPPSL